MHTKQQADLVSLMPEPDSVIGCRAVLKQKVPANPDQQELLKLEFPESLKIKIEILSNFVKQQHNGTEFLMTSLLGSNIPRAFCPQLLPGV